MRKWIASATLYLCVVASGSAHATIVKVEGHITSFTGTVGSDGQFTTYFIENDNESPYSVCPDAGCGTGIGVLHQSFDPLVTTSLEFYNTDYGSDVTHNSVALSAFQFQDVQLGQDFLLGTVYFTNGTWFTDPEITVHFQTTSIDPAFNLHVFDDTLHLTITTNDPLKSPYQNADFLYFVNHPQLGSIRAFELADSPFGGNTVAVDLYGHIGSLDPSYFANATGGGFIDPSVGLEPTVPEPSVFALLALALGGGAAAAARASALVERFADATGGRFVGPRVRLETSAYIPVQAT